MTQASGDGVQLQKAAADSSADMAFNSIDSAINDSSFMNRNSWAPAPQLPRLRTYTKVYKRGTVGRSIDITRYSGYEELKQDLARVFGIEGQLEDRQRIGWKLVYVDHENDVLLVGEDPWEEFVNRVRCINILSPQEVQQMSLDGDFGNNVLPNQQHQWFLAQQLALQQPSQYTQIDDKQKQLLGEMKKNINTELWQACAGPLVNLPAAGSHVVYFPQGHNEQVAASMKKDVDAQIPNYPNLPSKLLCLLHNVTLHADPETDEVYAQMTLQPVPSFDKEALLRSDLSTKANKPQTEFFCKTLTNSDTGNHGGFSVPRRAAEKIFPPLDFTMQPPAQEFVARDLHDNVWIFRHIYREQPKSHLLTTGWSLFVSGKRLLAGDSVLFIRDEKQQLLLGIRWANRQPTNLSSSVLSSDTMHIGILAAAAHAAANNSPFTVFYNPRASPSEFVIPLAKYNKAVCSNQISLGMRFRMMFEAEESGTRRYMGTITGISDLDPVKWKNSHWRNLQVGWDEPTAGGRPHRVSIWEIEPVTAPFFICPTPFSGLKRPRRPGMPDDDDDDSDLDNLLKMARPWLGSDFSMNGRQALPGLSLVQWMNEKSAEFIPGLPAAQVQAQLPQAPSLVPRQNVNAAISEHLDQHQQLRAASVESVCQPRREFSSSSSADVSQFRHLLRKAVYPSKSSSINQDTNPTLLFGIRVDTSQDKEIQSDQKNDKFDHHLGLSLVPFSGNYSSGGDILFNSESTKEPKSGLSPEMVLESFEMPDMIFNPILSDRLPHLSTFIKVYKRGAVSRSIDITRYSSFEELKVEIARIFDIEDQQTIGWKFFYVNRENDILLFNEEPWEQVLLLFPSLLLCLLCGFMRILFN